MLRKASLEERGASEVAGSGAGVPKVFGGEPISTLRKVHDWPFVARVGRPSLIGFAAHLPTKKFGKAWRGPTVEILACDRKLCMCSLYRHDVVQTVWTHREGAEE